MKKLILVVGVMIVVLVVVLLIRGMSDKAAPEAKTPEAVVETILTPEPPPPEPVELSVLEFESVAVPEPIEDSEMETPEQDVTKEIKTVPGVRLKPGQVLAIVNGMPLTTEKLMPPGQIRESGEKVLPVEVVLEVLDRSIERELIFQEALGNGVALDTRGVNQLNDMYKHLTSLPLDLGGGWTLDDLNVMGDENDAAWHVRDKASRLLQLEMLHRDDKPDTAENRIGLRDRLVEEADIEVVDLEEPIPGVSP